MGIPVAEDEERVHRGDRGELSREVTEGKRDARCEMFTQRRIKRHKV